MEKPQILIPLRYAVFALLNSLMGAGLLAMPFAFHKMGIIMSIFFLLVCGSLALTTIYLLGCVSMALEEDKKDVSYSSAALQSMPTIPWLVDSLVALKGFGVSIGYLILVGNSIPLVIHKYSNASSDVIYMKRQFWISLCTLFFCLPLCMTKTLSALKYASTFAMFSIFYLIVVVVVCTGFYFGDGHPIQANIVPVSWSSMISYISVFVYSYTCHQNVFQLYKELGHKSPKRITLAGFISILTAFIVYIILGVCGSSIAGSAIKDTIIATFETPTTLVHASIASRDPQFVSISISQLMIAFLVLTCFPMQTHSARNSIISLVSMASRNKSLLESKKCRWIVAFCLCLCSATVACCLESFVLVVKWVGAFATAPMVLVLPCVFYLTIVKKRNAFSYSVTGLSLVIWVLLIAAIFIQQ